MSELCSFHINQHHFPATRFARTENDSRVCVAVVVVWGSCVSMEPEGADDLR